MLSHKSVLIVAAHPDDEVLGCGGTCCRLTAAGARVSLLILGEGATSRYADRCDLRAQAEVETLRAQAVAAAQKLGVEPRDIYFSGLPDNRFDGVNLLDIVKQVESIKAIAQPSLVLTHHCGDLNVDHVITQRAVATAFRPLPGQIPVALYSFEVASSTEYALPAERNPFCPNTYVDISTTIDRKLAALSCYGEEAGDGLMPRSPESVRGMCALRGRTVGLTLAEAFVLLRQIVV